jgi:hypothetical protein
LAPATVSSRNTLARLEEICSSTLLFGLCSSTGTHRPDVRLHRPVSLDMCRDACPTTARSNMGLSRVCFLTALLGRIVGWAGVQNRVLRDNPSSGDRARAALVNVVAARSYNSAIVVIRRCSIRYGTDDHQSCSPSRSRARRLATDVRIPARP